MNRLQRQRLRRRDEGRRRVGVVTAGTAVVGSVLAATFGVLLANTDADAAAVDAAATSDDTVPLPSYGSTSDSDDVTRTPLSPVDPEPAGSAAPPAVTAPQTSSTQLSPPTRAPRKSAKSKRHASSGAS